MHIEHKYSMLIYRLHLNVPLEATSYKLMLTWSPAAQKISLTACRVDEVDSVLGVSDTSSNSVGLESLPNTHAFITG